MGFICVQLVGAVRPIRRRPESVVAGAKTTAAKSATVTNGRVGIVLVGSHSLWVGLAPPPVPETGEPIVNFTREQVAHLRRLIEVSTDRASPEALTDVERLADVLGAQLDMEDDYADGSMSDDELDERERAYQQSQNPF